MGDWLSPLILACFSPPIEVGVISHLIYTHAKAIIMISGTVITLNSVVINTERPAPVVFVPYCSVIMDCAEDAGRAAVRIMTFFNVSSSATGTIRNSHRISNGNAICLINVKRIILRSWKTALTGSLERDSPTTSMDIPLVILDRYDSNFPSTSGIGI